MADLFIKRGDNVPVVRARLTDNGTPIDNDVVSSVTFYLRPLRPRSAAVVVSGEAAMVDPEEMASGSDDGKGWVDYAWGALDTAELAGGYRAEFEVEFSGGDVGTFPNDRDILIAVLGDVDDEEES